MLNTLAMTVLLLLSLIAPATPSSGDATPAPVDIGPFGVAITHIERDANDHFADHGNPEPEEGSAYAVIGLAIENRGEETINTRELHLDVYVDGVEVSDWMCPTVVNGTIDNEKPEMRPGAETEIELCAQLPPEGELEIEAFVNGEEPVLLELPEEPTASPVASPAS